MLIYLAIIIVTTTYCFDSHTTFASTFLPVNVEYPSEGLKILVGPRAVSEQGTFFCRVPRLLEERCKLL